jgi:hypothetical protein
LIVPVQLTATAAVSYTLISGSLPTGLVLSQVGVITGTPEIVTKDTTYTFVVRATSADSKIRDRTFSMIVSGVVTPEFITESGLLLTPLDSEWIEYQILYTNPISADITVRLVQGQLPPGLEINDAGLIRGYPLPPTINQRLPTVTTSALVTSSVDNSISCLSTSGFSLGRPIIFTGTVFGGITAGQTYFVKTFEQFKFTISTTADGPTTILEGNSGYMTVTLPEISVGQPTVRTYSFTLGLESEFGGDVENYSISVTNRQLPTVPFSPREPTIYNTRPATYNIEQDTVNYGYYLLPNSSGETYPPADPAYIGKFQSDNKFAFRILGHDFDNDNITYVFTGLPISLGADPIIGDPVTGWVTGTPIISDNTISNYPFSVVVRKTDDPTVQSPIFNFYFTVANDIVGEVTWVTPNDLGIIENGSVSVLNVLAESDLELTYEITSGSLPPNLSLLSNGEITGTVAYQPTNTLLDVGDTTEYTFTVRAFSSLFPTIVTATRTFTVTVLQVYSQPTDTLYIKCTPDLDDRQLLNSLLESETLIPNEFLYRTEDPNFGKATSVIYTHAYGIYANQLAAYLAAVSKNHYWRYITLGEIKTAVAKNDQGEVIYEVVYSQVIDNLINPQGISVSKEIYWPRPIDLHLGPWYTSVDDIYTSYIASSAEGYSLLTEIGDLITTENLFIIETESGPPFYYTSLTSGEARTLYPNSLPNMREQVGDVLGQDFNFRLYPKWMTSQQANGSTLGFTPAWVIAYCKPGILVTTDTVSSGSFTIGQMYTIKSIGTTDFTEIGAASNTVGLTFTATNIGNGSGTAYLTTGMTYAAFSSTGLKRSDYKSYTEQLQFNIQYGWKTPIGDLIKLNQINFRLDRFTVDKSATYDYDTELVPPAWTSLPSATPTPDPKDSEDFYVLYPRETILPNTTQY